MLDDDFAALDALGLTAVSYTDGTPQQQARLMVAAVIGIELQAIQADGFAGLMLDPSASPSALLAAVGFAAEAAQATAALALLS